MVFYRKGLPQDNIIVILPDYIALPLQKFERLANLYLRQVDMSHPEICCGRTWKNLKQHRTKSHGYLVRYADFVEGAIVQLYLKGRKIGEDQGWAPGVDDEWIESWFWDTEGNDYWVQWNVKDKVIKQNRYYVTKNNGNQDTNVKEETFYCRFVKI